VLGAGLEEDLHALFQTQAWYNPFLDTVELFRLWVLDSIEAQEDPQWLLQLLRVRDRPLLCEAVGIPRTGVIGKSPREIASMILAALGFPSVHVHGCTAIPRHWVDLARLVDAGEDERAAVLARQRAERYLRRILLFFVQVGWAPQFVAILREPNKLRIPQRLMSVVDKSGESVIPALIACLEEDGWADLGFLTLALRRFSSELQKADAKHPSGSTLEVFTDADSKAFLELATALQSYAHDNPTRMAQRRGELLKGIQNTSRAILESLARRVVPDEMLVLETSDTLLGKAFAGNLDTGKRLRLSSDRTPNVGRKVFFLCSADRDSANCLWTESPWPAPT